MNRVGFLWVCFILITFCAQSQEPTEYSIRRGDVIEARLVRDLGFIEGDSVQVISLNLIRRGSSRTMEEFTNEGDSLNQKVRDLFIYSRAGTKIFADLKFRRSPANKTIYTRNLVIYIIE